MIGNDLLKQSHVSIQIQEFDRSDTTATLNTCDRHLHVANHQMKEVIVAQITPQITVDWDFGGWNSKMTWEKMQTYDY